MSKPLISVVIPCFNVVDTVAETIASVSAQTIKNFEIVAVDNNCTDETVSLLEEIAEREPRLRVVTQSIQGLSAARNAGIKAALGEYVALFDADDLWDEDYLESHLAGFKDNPTAGISFSRVRLIDVAGRPTGAMTQQQSRSPTARSLLRSNPCTSLIVVRADVFEKVGLFNEELRVVEDQEWLFRAAYAEIEFVSLDRVLASYRVMPGGLSADLEAMVRGHGQLLLAAADVAPELVAQNRRLAEAAMFRYCARRAIQQGKGLKAARSYLGKMLRTAPDLLIWEPQETLSVVGQVLLPGMRKLLPRRSKPLQAGEA